ncbi:MAG: polysaccharide biosynthesis C-terminal domain-containing protein [Oscillospiraceae bacterium]|nr:polysaccharide biosynthesis C-terminal domain-containing protein [Oscillospiraceae bacterium]
MGKRRTLVRGTLLLAISGLALRGIGVWFQSLLTARIGAEGMGILQLVLTVGGFAGTLGSAGVRVAALQLTARAWGQRDRPGVAAALYACLRYGFLVSAVVGAGLILLANPLSRCLLREPRTALALRILGALLPISILTGVLRAAFTACGRLRELVGVELGERLLCAALTLLFLTRAGTDPAKVCGAVVAGSYGAGIFSCLLLYAVFRRTLPQPCALPPVAARAVPLGFNDALRSGLGALEQFLIPYGLEKHGSRSTALAAYGTVSGMVFPVLWFPSEIIFALCELLVSELSRLLAGKAHRRLRQLVRKSLIFTALYAFGISAVLWLGGSLLGEAIYHSPQAGRYLRIFSPMVLFLYLDAVVDGLQKGMGQQLYLVRYNSFTNVIDVLGLWLLLPRFGLAGYIFTYCLSHLVNFFLSLRRLLVVVETPELAE